MATLKLKQLWKKEYFRTVFAIIIVVCIVGGSYLGLQLALGTSDPIRVVGSGSMCTAYGGTCNNFLSLTHPFEHTLHTGDLILIQRVNPQDLETNYPNSDIIVYRNPNGATPIVHRIAEKQEINGILYFKTKGDGNGPIIWPEIPDYYDRIPDEKGVPEDLVEGKVVLRIPWFGWIALIMQNNVAGLPLIVGLIILLVVLEFVLPLVKKRRQSDSIISTQMSL